MWKRRLGGAVFALSALGVLLDIARIGDFAARTFGKRGPGTVDAVLIAMVGHDLVMPRMDAPAEGVRRERYIAACSAGEAVACQLAKTSKLRADLLPESWTG